MAELAPGRVVAGKFRLDRLLARGGMGAVWSAHHLRLEVPVAIKFMSASLADSAEARMRFEREAKAAAQLRTPHVVQIHDHGVDDDTPYIVMELLEGEDLGARFKRERQMALPDVARIVLQACKALRLAHDAGIVHRDLKPGNIFLARSDDEEVVKILDFGIAKATRPGVLGEATRTGELLGSPHYMSPEQSRGIKSLDHRTDLWSLGVIVYRAITGKKPFVGESMGDVIVRICTEDAIPPTQIVAGLPAEIDHFFQKALARDPARRFQSARELAAAFLEACGSIEPSFASRTGGMSLSGAAPSLAPPSAPATPPLLTPPGGTITTYGSVQVPAAARARRTTLFGGIAAAGALLAIVAVVVIVRVARDPAGTTAAEIPATGAASEPAPATAPPATASPAASATTLAPEPAAASATAEPEDPAKRRFPARPAATSKAQAPKLRLGY